MEFLRQLQLFNPEEFDTPVHVIGAGATGSWLTLILAKLGVKQSKETIQKRIKFTTLIL